MDRTQRWVGLLLGVLVLAVLVGVSYRVLDQHVIESRRPEPEVAPRPSLGAWGREEVVKLAARLPVADVTERTVMPPPLEIERESSPSRSEPLGSGVQIVTGFEGSVPLDIRKHSDGHFAVRILTEGHRNWFMFRVEGVPAGGRVVRIDLEAVNLGKWRSLNPVYSYASRLDDLSAFGSAPGSASPVAAWNGPLLPDTTGQQWHYVPDVWSEGTSTLSLVHRFERDGYVAMRVPYTPSYDQAFLASLQGHPRAEVVRVGSSGQGRPLQLVRIGEGDPTRTPVVLMYAREHASEPDSSWVVEGAIRFLVSDDPEAARLRQTTTFLMLPIMDPDGAAAGLYDRITTRFSSRDTPPEVLAYATWFEQWVDSGHRLDVVLNLHNIESAEAEHLFNYFCDPNRLEAATALHAAIRGRFAGTPIQVGREVRGGYTINRLGGWLGYYFGPVAMLYEVNSQEKRRHLSLAEVRQVGEQIVKGCADFGASDSASAVLALRDGMRDGRLIRLEAAGRALNPIATAERLQWTTIVQSQKPASDQTPAAR